MLSKTLNEISDIYLNDLNEFSDVSFQNKMLNKYNSYLKRFFTNHLTYTKFNSKFKKNYLVTTFELNHGFQANFIYSIEERSFEISVCINDELDNIYFSNFILETFKNKDIYFEENKIIIKVLNIKELHDIQIKVKFKIYIDIIRQIYNQFESEDYNSQKIFYMLFDILKDFSNKYFFKRYEHILKKFLLKYLDYHFFNVTIIENKVLTIVNFNNSFQLCFNYDFSSNYFEVSIGLVENSENKLFYNYVINTFKNSDFYLKENEIIIANIKIHESNFNNAITILDKSMENVKSIYNSFSKDSSLLIQDSDSKHVWVIGYDKFNIDSIVSDFYRNNTFKYSFNFVNEFDLDQIKSIYDIKSLLPNIYFYSNYITNVKNFFSIKKDDIIIIGSKNNLHAIGIVMSDDIKKVSKNNFEYKINFFYYDKLILNDFNFRSEDISKLSIQSWNSNIFMEIVNSEELIKNQVIKHILNAYFNDYDSIIRKYDSYIKNVKSFSKNNNGNSLIQINSFDTHPEFKKRFEKFHQTIKNDSKIFNESLNLCHKLKNIYSKNHIDIIRFIYNKSSLLVGTTIKKQINKLPDEYISCIYESYMELIKVKYFNKGAVRIILSNYKNNIKKEWKHDYGHQNVLLTLLLFYESLDNSLAGPNDKLVQTIDFFNKNLLEKLDENYSITDCLFELNFKSIFDKIDLNNLTNFYILSLWMFDDEFGGYLSKTPQMLDYNLLICEKNVPYSKEIIPINLSPDSVFTHLNDLNISEIILTRICSSLNAGKNIILNGSCGTGKTNLAEIISKTSKNENFTNDYILTTATSDWSTFDTIGGLMPNKRGELTFHQGKVLEAIASNKWLIIDEINRADIDKSFGQLFTVLSGHDVELPFQENDLPISIKLWDKLYCKHDENTATYYIGKNWRIIGTMNVDDKDSLFDLSYAFMRRFMFINVDLPNRDEYISLINMWAKDLDEFYQNKLLQFYNLLEFKPIGPAIFKDMVEYLFVRIQYDNSNKNKIFGEAVNAYIVPQLEGLNEKEINKIKNFLFSIELLDYVEPKLNNLMTDL